MENGSNDGDSFHVQYKSKEFIFRLYFVDTCESSEQVPARVEQQAKFIGISTDRVLEAGKVAKEITHKYLANQNFTVVTRWEDAMGASRLPRNYAFVLFGKNDEHDLASTLVQNGLARIYGMPADPPGSVSGAQFLNELRKLDAFARQQRLGFYGNLNAATTAAGSGVAGGVPSAGGASKGSYVPISMLLPATSHPPDVVDNPADEELANYAVQIAETPMVVQTGIPDRNYSEIPGWKPGPTPAVETPSPSPIPVDEISQPQSSAEKIAPAPLSAPVSLNRASEQELLSLPGIGPVLARRIIAARPYSSVDDLARVKGLGKNQIAKLRPFLSL